MWWFSTLIMKWLCYASGQRRTTTAPQYTQQEVDDDDSTDMGEPDGPSGLNLPYVYCTMQFMLDLKSFHCCHFSMYHLKMFRLNLVEYFDT